MSNRHYCIHIAAGTPDEKIVQLITYRNAAELLQEYVPLYAGMTVQVWAGDDPADQSMYLSDALTN